MEPTAWRPHWSNCRSLLQWEQHGRSQETGPRPSGHGGRGAQEWLPRGLRAPCKDITDSVVSLQWPEACGDQRQHPRPPRARNLPLSGLHPISALAGKTDTLSEGGSRDLSHRHQVHPSFHEGGKEAHAGRGPPRGTRELRAGGTESRGPFPAGPPRPHPPADPCHACRLTSPPRPAQSSPFGGSDHGHAEPVRATARPGCQMRVKQAEPSRSRRREQSISPWGHICNRNKQVPGSGARPALRRV